MEIQIKRHKYNLNPDITRVVCNYFSYGDEARIKRIADRVSGLNEKESENEYNRLLRDFSPRHKNFIKLIESNYKKVEGLLSETTTLSDLKKQLIGAYFSSEYSFEAAALMNPSMVPGQTNDSFVLSLRQVGEGHISSIGFRNGMIDKAGNISAKKLPHMRNCHRSMIRDLTSGYILMKIPYYQNASYSQPHRMSVMVWRMPGL